LKDWSVFSKSALQVYYKQYLNDVEMALMLFCFHLLWFDVFFLNRLYHFSTLILNLISFSIDQQIFNYLPNNWDLYSQFYFINTKNGVVSALGIFESYFEELLIFQILHNWNDLSWDVWNAFYEIIFKFQFNSNK